MGGKEVAEGRKHRAVEYNITTDTQRAYQGRLDKWRYEASRESLASHLEEFQQDGGKLHVELLLQASRMSSASRSSLTLPASFSS